MAVDWPNFGSRRPESGDVGQTRGRTAITIDLEAYALLSRRKREGQSFSQVIKQHFGPQPTAGRFLAALRAARPSESSLDSMDVVVGRRRRDPARAAAR